MKGHFKLQGVGDGKSWNVDRNCDAHPAFSAVRSSASAELHDRACRQRPSLSYSHTTKEEGFVMRYKRFAYLEAAEVALAELMPSPARKRRVTSLPSRASRGGSKRGQQTSTAPRVGTRVPLARRTKFKRPSERVLPPSARVRQRSARGDGRGEGDTFH